MRSTRLWQVFVVAVTIIVALLVAGMFRLGAAIRRGEVVPPTVDLELGIVRIVAYTTHDPECPAYTDCGPESVAPPQAFYVVWSIYEPATAEQPYGRTARRVLAMPLNLRWNGP